MILSNAPQHEAVVSNVAEIGEFRIRNSAKAFSILSSGLYANKIRAIIRELSCNAVDSHAAAGKRETPFDVHLPNALEPHFSIRDYGTGLSHQQVTQIYTTYFESTKTASNEFIGALGLGSKSPFSYTDNFTVTAIKDGVKGIYSAFINAEGVPSIALMMSEPSDSPSGVEVRFSVNDAQDYDKFRQEARQVYTHFALHPVISGVSNFQFTNIDYESRDIVPGVHAVKNQRYSVAVMGNIAYPIDIPKADSSLGELRTLLSCGLELHFGIGELDFQASREGLSYIPQTITAIKNKLSGLNDILTVKLAEDANLIENLWERAIFLYKKKDLPLWRAAVIKYAIDSKLPTFDPVVNNYIRLKEFNIKVEDLASKYNMVIRGFVRHNHNKSLTKLSPLNEYAPNGAKDASGAYISWKEWSIHVDSDCNFIISDVKGGAGERVRYHYRESPGGVYSQRVYVLEKADKTKDMDTAGFFAEICQPPESQQLLVSALKQKVRVASIGMNVSLLSLQRRGGSGYRRDESDMVWRDAGALADLDTTQTYYYVPLSGFTMQSTKGYTSGQELYSDVQAVPNLFSGTIYGVRKAEIEQIKKLPNWKNFEDYIQSQLKARTTPKLLLSSIKGQLNNLDFLDFSTTILTSIDNEDGTFAKLFKELKNVDKFKNNYHSVERLLRNFTAKSDTVFSNHVSVYQAKVDEVNSRYPLLKTVNAYRANVKDIAEYINLIDAKKGI